VSLYNIATLYLLLAVFFPLNHKCDITGLTSAGVDGGHDSVKRLAISIDQNLGSPVVLLGPGPTSCCCCFCIYLHRHQTTAELSKISPCCFCIYLHRHQTTTELSKISPCCFCIYLHRQQTTTDLSKISPSSFCIYLHR